MKSKDRLQQKWMPLKTYYTEYENLLLIFMYYYSCGVLMPVCLSVCVRVCLSICVHDNSKNNGSIDLKLEHIVVYENSSDEFDIGHCLIKVKDTA